MTYLKESRILKEVPPTEQDITHRTLNLEAAVWYNKESVDGGEFRADFVLYMRKVDKSLNADVASEKWGCAVTYDPTLNASTNNPRSPDLATRFRNGRREMWAILKVLKMGGGPLGAQRCKFRRTN